MYQEEMMSSLHNCVVDVCLQHFFSLCQKLRLLFQHPFQYQQHCAGLEQILDLPPQTCEEPPSTDRYFSSLPLAPFLEMRNCQLLKKKESFRSS